MPRRRALLSDAAVPAPVRPAPDMSVLPYAAVRRMARHTWFHDPVFPFVHLADLRQRRPAGARGRQRLALLGHGPPAPRKPDTANDSAGLPAGTQGLIDSSPSGCWPMNPSQLLYVLVDMQSHETRVQVQPLERQSRRNPGRPFRWLDRASGPGPRRRVALAVVIGGLVLATFGLINISSLLLLAGVGVLVAVVRRHRSAR